MPRKPDRHRGARASNLGAPALKPLSPLALAGGNVGVALALRVYGIGEQELWYDEAFSFHMATLENAVDYILYDYNPPLYYLLLRLWVSLVGHSEAALRLLSAGFGTAFVAAVIWFGRVVFNWRVALWAGGLAAVAPIHIYYSQETRGYALLLLLLAVCYGAFWLALERRLTRYWWATGVSALGALYTHYFALFALAPLPLLFLARRETRKDHGQRTRMAAAVALVALVYLPWVYFRFVATAPEVARTPDYDWRLQMWEATHPALAIPRSLEVFLLGADSSLPTIFLKQITHIRYPAALRWVGLGVLALLAVVAAVSWNERRMGIPDAARRKLTIAALVLLPLAAMWLVSFHRPIYLTARYDLVAFPAFLLLAGFALAKLHSARPRGLPALALAAVLGTALAVKLAYYYAAEPVRVQAATARGLDAQVRTGDAVLFTGVRGVTVRYYLGQLGYNWQDGLCRSASGDREFRCRMFPRGTERTFVFDRAAALAAGGAMHEEVRGLVASLPPDRSVWVVFGDGTVRDGRFIPNEVDALLVDELGRSSYTAAESDAGPAVFQFRRSS